MTKELSRQRRWQLKMKDAGLCIICAKKVALGSRGRFSIYCESHRTYHIERNKERAKRVLKERENKGLCTLCGKRKQAQGYQRCLKCKRGEKKRMAEYRRELI